VLVVDDDEAVREVAEGLLAEAGFRVETVASGGAALARVREGGVGAVLLDLVMPDLSGADVLRALAAEHPELPVVLASGYKRELAAERIGRESAFAFVQKPYDPEALCAALGEALEKGSGAGRSPPGRA
jgi:DNA-binding NtrC family response regulator